MILFFFFFYFFLYFIFLFLSFFILFSSTLSLISLSTSIPETRRWFSPLSLRHARAAHAPCHGGLVAPSHGSRLGHRPWPHPAPPSLALPVESALPAPATTSTRRSFESPAAAPACLLHAPVSTQLRLSLRRRLPAPSLPTPAVIPVPGQSGPWPCGGTTRTNESRAKIDI